MMLKLKNHFNATRFDFQIHVHTLQPWPSGNKAIAIGWQRGKKRRGATNSMLPLPTPDARTGRATVVRFNERIGFKATLYKAPGATERGGVVGPFKRKCVILAVLETDGRTHATAALGRVVIDLAEFASIDGHELRTLPVACSKAIQSAVGAPQLTVTIRCRWKKAGADFTADEAASMSTDQSGSSLTGTVKDFFARALGGGGGARGGGGGGHGASDHGGRPLAPSPMEVISEDDGGANGSPHGGGGGGIGGVGSSGGGGGGVGGGAGSPAAGSHELDPAEWEGLGAAGGASDGPDYYRLDESVGMLNIHDARDGDADADAGSFLPPAAATPAPGSYTSSPASRGAAPRGAAAAAAAPAGADEPAAAAAAVDVEDDRSGAGGSGGRGRLVPGAAVAAAAAAPAPAPRPKGHDSDSVGSGAGTPEPGAGPPGSGPLPAGPATPWPAGEKWTPTASPAAVAVRPAAPSSAAPPRAPVAAAPPAVRPPAPPPPVEPPMAVPRAAVHMASVDDGSAEMVAQLQDELLTAAALEFCVHLAQRPVVLGRRPSRAIHAPARRIVRTLVCLGREDGIPFGHAVLRHVHSAAVANRSDIAQLAFWWTNACHMRGFLQSLNLGRRGEAGEYLQPHWAAEAFVPRLLGQEKFIYDELVSYVWTHTLVPKVAAARARPPIGPVANRRSAHEAALRKWLEALEAANAQLRALGREGHVSMLRQQVLLELLKRVDALLFHYLITPPSGPFGSDAASAAATPTAAAGPAFGGGHDGDAAGEAARHANALPALDDSMLFFTRGALTFGTGMQLKMACTRLQQWAFGDGGLRDIWSQLPDQGQAIFRLLKGASDLLMMPKDMLTDPEVRRDAVTLPIATVAYMMARFAPDDYSPDGVAPAVAAALRREAEAAGADPGAPPAPEIEAEGTYYSPTDDMVMEKVEIGEEAGLEYSAESSDELEAVSELGTDLGVPPPLRFKLLHNLWAAGVPRTRSGGGA